MTRYEVFLRGVVPNVRVYDAETPVAARKQAEAEGYRVRLVKPLSDDPGAKELRRTGIRRKGKVSGKGHAGYRKPDPGPEVADGR